jgi:hypothetical protein
MPTAGQHRDYEVVFHGESEALARAFPDRRVEFTDGNTSFIGAIRDQAQLFGVLHCADSLGFELGSVNPIEAERE